MLIKHKYVHASDDIAQYTADDCGRQEVTREGAEHAVCVIGEDIYAWSQSNYDMGLDPWFMIDHPDDRPDARYFITGKVADQFFRQRKMSFEEIQAIAADITFNDWTIYVGRKGEAIYLQIRADGEDNMNPGEKMTWSGRKWQLSEYMVKSEVVRTAYKAVMCAMEHEVSEQFRYKGEPIYDPHMDVEKLLELRQRDDALETRSGGAHVQ